MWASLIEKNEPIRAVYGEHVPRLEGLILREVNILPGEDLIIKMKIDLSELPKNMPRKWVANNVNSVQISLDLIQSEIEAFALGTAIATVERIEIQEFQGRRKVRLANGSGKEILVINATWIYLTALNGYHASSDDS